jgi:UDP-glucuronate 4-epimerase
METPVLNIGNPKTITLTKFINILEKNLSKKSKKKFLRRQPGDVLETKAIINFERKKLKLLFETELGEGINRFVNWHNNYH